MAKILLWAEGFFHVWVDVFLAEIDFFPVVDSLVVVAALVVVVVQDSEKLYFVVCLVYKPTKKEERS